VKNMTEKKQAQTETPFDSPDDTVEIVCPNCNETGYMVQHQQVWHRYPIAYSHNGGDIDHNGGDSTKEWAGNGEDDCYICLNCETEFTYDALLETDQALALQEEGDDE
jgi:DNA-directed RNA polymerase subunit RPC12/RpoP